MSPRTAVRLTRWWTRAYTVLVPPDARLARRQEVESDLWESITDPGMSRQILPRLLLGIVDDLTWSIEHMDNTARTSTWWSLGTLVTFAVAWLWLASAPASETMRESAVLFPAALTLHLLGIVAFVALRGFVDARVAGLAFGDLRVADVTRRAGPWTAIALVVTVLSGMALYMADPVRMLGNVMFRVKLTAMALAVIDAWFMHAIALRGARDWGTTVTPALARTSAYVSIALWVIVLVAGQLIAFAPLN